MSNMSDANHLSGEIPAKQAGIVFGFEEFWPKVYAQYKPQFDAIGDLIRLANQMLQVAEESDAEPAKNVIRVLTGATLTGACEAVLLCGNGCGTGAMKIVAECTSLDGQRNTCVGIRRRSRITLNSGRYYCGAGFVGCMKITQTRRVASAQMK